MSLPVGTVIEMVRDAPYKEYGVFKGDIGIINYVAKSRKYSVHIYGKSNPHKDALGSDRKYGEPGDCWIPFECVKEYEYKKFDRIKIISDNSKYNGCYGTILEETYDWVYVFVDGMSSYSHIRFKKSSVIPIDVINKIEGETIMKLSGFTKVAVIEYCNKDYHYALYDNDIKVGDNVLVTGELANKQTLVVKNILTLEEAREVYDGVISAEIRCKIDLSAYEQRVKNREEADKLRKKMDEEIRKMDELNKYEMYAASNPVLKEMLEKFKGLGV